MTCKNKWLITILCKGTNRFAIAILYIFQYSIHA